jgi:hypothetical protein
MRFASVRGALTKVGRSLIKHVTIKLIIPNIITALSWKI